ncbi:MAG: hypothetical protein K0S44_602 [Bacteroidetes bacterium]|jgi:hypothetical protein|nr:hypothetical protein [Bacteroidota bacterium]
MSQKKFKAKLEKMGSWIVVKIPFDVKKTYGSAGYIRIKGTIEHLPLKTSLMPMGEGVHCFPVNLGMRKEIGKDAGDSVSVVIEQDNEKPVLEIPIELKQAFKASKEAKKMFDSFSPSMKKEHCRYISEGKKEETRINRAVATVLKLEKLYLEKAENHLTK